MRPKPPFWIRGLRRVLQLGPRGTYAIVSSLTRGGDPFGSTLARDLGHARFTCELEDEIAREVCFTGMYEPSMSRIFQQRLRPGATVVDAGANWGYFTLLAAALVGASGRVLALEPDPRQFSRLMDNIALNAFTQVTPVQLAAAATQRRGTLVGYDEQARNRGVSRLSAGGRSGEGFDVQCDTIDAITSTWPRIDLVKIDVEGAEADVLAGMRQGLAAHRYAAILVELHPALLRERGSDPQACMDALASSQYRGFAIDMSARTYRRALRGRVSIESLLQPLDRALESSWPHLLWVAPAEPV